MLLRDYLIIIVLLSINLNIYAHCDEQATQPTQSYNIDSVTKAIVGIYSPLKVYNQDSIGLVAEKFRIAKSQKHINRNRILSAISVDKTKAVGQIPIRSSVTPSGALSYDIPIECYPGINGMTPDLAISYNSQRGNSLMGIGWSLCLAFPR